MECSKGWSKRCAASKGAKCTCQCGGENHGKDHHKPDTQNPLVLDKFDGEILNYLGYGMHQSMCGVKITRDKNHATVVLTELPNNPGTSITNAYEDIATQLYKERLQDLPPEAITWIEHYPVRGKFFGETFDRVLLQWKPTDSQWQGGKVIGVGRFAHPQWSPMAKEEVA